MRIDSPGRGIACMVAACFLVTANDAAVKWLNTDYPVGQILFVRGLFAFIAIALVVRHNGGVSTLRVTAYSHQAFRAALTVCGTFMFIVALRGMPLAEVIAVTFAAPIFLTAMAPWFLREQVGWRRWLAVCVGFAGVIIIMRPSHAGLGLIPLLALGAAFCESLKDIVTRRMLVTEHSNAILVVSSASIMLSGLISNPADWLPLPAQDLAVLAACGVMLGGAHFFLIEAYRYSEAIVVSPFKYTMVVWATLLGFLVWGEIPDGVALAGLTLVIGSGLYIFRREARRRPIAL